MGGSQAFDPIHLPDEAWRTPEAERALRERDFRAILMLGRKYGITQTRITASSGITQSRISAVQNGHRGIVSLDVIERLATAFNMPDHARVKLGLAPRGYTESSSVHEPSKDAARRACDICGNPLSRYNSDTTCQACFRSGRKEGATPQAFASEASGPFHAVAAQGDIGASSAILDSQAGADMTPLRRTRREFGWKIPRLIAELRRHAPQAGMTLGSDKTLKTTISRHENGHINPGEDWQKLYRLVYGRTNDQLGFVSPEIVLNLTMRMEDIQRRLVRQEDDDEVMRRRAFISDVAALAGLGMTGSTTIAEPIRHELSSALSEERAAADADEWNEIALEYGETYWTTPPAKLFEALTGDILGLRTALRRCGNSDTQRELRRVGALLAAFTAQTVANLGSMREARRWWRTARQGADESRDGYATLWVRGREITRAMYERRTPAAIMRLIEEAEQFVAAGPKQAALEFLSGKAQTLAAMGRAADAEAALSEVRHYSDALPASSPEDGNVQFLWSEKKQYFTESYVYSHLANFAKADKARRMALPFYSPYDLRQPAQLELHQALCLARGRDVTEGMRHAKTVITHLPEEHRIQAIIDLGHGVLDATSEGDLNRPAVNDYREFLAASSPMRK